MMNCWTVACRCPSGTTNGEAANRYADSASNAISTRCRANRCSQLIGRQVHSANNIPTANHAA